MPDRVLAAIDRLADALERFREAYEAWLKAEGDGNGERERLLVTLADAEKQLDAARAELAAMQDISQP